MRLRTLALLLSLAAPVSLRAQSPYLVKDINATTAASPASSSPSNFFHFGSRVFFSASTPASGNELWSSDGTEAGTTQVAEINPGQASSSPAHFAVLNGKLIFSAADSLHGNELWTSDGTAAGTRLLADIRTGTAPSFPGDGIIYHDKLIFTANDGVDGNELWITDGTAAGTRFFKDLATGAGDSDPHDFVVFNDVICFSARDVLWKSDGTEAGTVPVKSGVYPGNLIVAGSLMFFAGYTEPTGSELWVSDGSEAGTRLVTEITPGQQGSVYRIVGFGNRVLILASDAQHGQELWISDGTAAGTHIVRDINPGAGSGAYTLPVVSDGGVAFFAGITPLEGIELWKTDGTESGTTLVRDIFPGPTNSNPSSFVSAGDKIYFFASNGGYPTLWISDGTAAGTTQVQSKDPVAVSGNSVPVVFGNLLYFTGANSLNGYEPWKSDGTEAGTSMIRNLARDAAPSSNPTNLIAAGDWVYFIAWDGSGPVSSNGGPFSMWRSDGTAEGTLRIGAVLGESNTYRTVGHTLYFTSSNTLWTSNGTPEGTAPAFPNQLSTPAAAVFVNGDTLFVSAYESNEYQLYAIRQTANALPEKLGVGGAYAFVEQAGRTIFFANGGLWSSDGTRAGTYAIVPKVADNGSAIVSMGGTIYYTTYGSTGTRLWRNDGTFESNLLIKILPNSASLLTVAERRLFFLCLGQLWTSDGTEGGTQALTTGMSLSNLAAAGSRVVFTGNDSANGPEPWVSDGTVAGTHLLRDIYPGTFGSYPSDLTSVRGAVYFTAADDLHGGEVWMTDGTPEGTKFAGEVEPGTSGSNPRAYVQAGDRLFFIAFTAATGIELWAMPLPTAPRLNVDDIRVAEGDSGSTTARFTVTLSAPSSQPVTVDYATSDGTALSGSDYDAASGTLTFASGQTAKNIDVRIRGDVNGENNETFFLTLRNASGAALKKASAFAIIDDDDQLADLGLSLDFSSFGLLEVAVNATNNGPRAATNIRVAHTTTPADSSSFCKLDCFAVAPPLLAGANEKVFQYRWFGFQQYLTATATIHERDPQPSNNSIGWVTNTYVAMDALFFTPGSQANVWFDASNTSSVSITSSDPSIISVPSTLTFASQPATFVAHGIRPGTATIRIFTPAFEVGTLTIDVVPSGTTPRWPGAILASPDNGGVSFDSPLGFSIQNDATAPYSGAKPTGTVVVSANGHELGRVVLMPDVNRQKVTNYLPDVGANAIRFDYSGDANFLPMSIASTVTVSTGRATILGGAERNGTAGRVHVRVTGSPSGAPTGAVTIAEPGVFPARTVTLAAGAPGEGQADINLTNVSAAPHTFVITYSGDSRYSSSTQQVRMNDARLRSVKH
jgi:ELWxxDGT repeat protein